MKNRLPMFIPVLVLAVVVSIPCAAQEHGNHTPLFEELGDHHHPITTNNEQAQRYFDQGLTLAYAFNHDEAVASFQEAARLDPECAMCYWGIAFALGPNINAPMFPQNVEKAWEALELAQQHAPKASAREQAYIEALSKRYVAEPVDDRSPLDAAFAEAMADVVRQYPEDLDAATLYAEALMDTMPWDYWLENGQPREATKIVMSELERAMEADPSHPGANHFYIHAVEKERPELGVAAADRLGSLVPAAGHLVHMPGHIYIRVGRYHDAVLANERAIEADEKYGLRHVHGLYMLGYMPHNPHFLWAAAALEGNGAKAVRAAQRVFEMTDRDAMRQPGMEVLQHYYVTPLYALVRFARWDEVLEIDEPDAELLYPRAVRHYAHGLAFARTDRLDEARVELAALTEITADSTLASLSVTGINPAAALLQIAEHVLAGQIAVSSGSVDEGISHLQQALAAEDGLRYEEPPAWYHPTRQMLGAVLLEEGRVEEAEAIFMEDLAQYPENGWSLYGLHRSLQAQGKDEKAAAALTRFHAAWSNADVMLSTSTL